MIKIAGQKGFAHLLLVILLLLGVGVGVYLATHQTFFKPQAGGAGGVEFVKAVGENYEAITTTTNPSVKVRLNGPWGASSNANLSSYPETEPIAIGGGSSDGPSEEPKKPIKNKKPSLKVDKNTVIVQGQLFQKIDVSRPEPIKNYQVEYCDPDGDGTQNYAYVEGDGKFSFEVKKGQSFCVRPPKIDGYYFPPVAVKALSQDSNYENQVAGVDCVKNSNKKDCKQNPKSASSDLKFDNTFDFVYSALTSTPTPVPTPKDQCQEDKDCGSGKYCGKLCGDSKGCFDHDPTTPCDSFCSKVCLPTIPRSPTPLPTPTSLPTPTPMPLFTKSVTLSENPVIGDDDDVTLNYEENTNYAMVTDYTFSDKTPGKKVLYVEYTSSNGTTSKGVPYPAIITLENCGTSCPVSPTPFPTLYPTFRPSIVPTPTPFVTPKLTLVSPLGGETFNVGQTMLISWNIEGKFDFIDIFTKEGTSVSSITRVYCPCNQTYNFIVPAHFANRPKQIWLRGWYKSVQVSEQLSGNVNFIP